MKQIQIGENTYELLPSATVHLVLHGEQTDEIAKGYLALHDHAVREFGGRVRYLIDMNGAGKISPKARRMVKGLALAGETEKVAVYGTHPLSRHYANLVLKSFGNDNSRFFPDRPRAEAWLAE
ncbi:MAG: hypothetical protein R2751_06210 [Bacteroidales bacterium]